MSIAGKILEKMGTVWTLDQVRNKLNEKIWKEYSKIESQEDYDKFLAKYKRFGDLIDKYFVGGDLNATVNALHYQQSLDRKVPEFLDSL